jgi:hypothetical protein
VSADRDGQVRTGWVWVRILGSLCVFVCRVLTLNVASNNLGEEGAKLVAQALPRYAMLIADDMPACIDLTALFYSTHPPVLSCNSQTETGNTHTSHAPYLPDSASPLMRSIDIHCALTLLNHLIALSPNCIYLYPISTDRHQHPPILPTTCADIATTKSTTSATR